MAFVDFEPGDIKGVELRFNDFKPEQKQGKQGDFTLYRYTVDHYAETQGALTTKIDSGDKYGWKLDLFETAHNLVQQVNPQQGDKFLIRRPTKAESSKKKPWKVWHWRDGRWNEVIKDDASGFDPNAAPAGPDDGPQYDFTDTQDPNALPPQQSQPRQQQPQSQTGQGQGQQQARSGRVEGWMISTYMVASTTAGLCHPAARRVPVTPEQFTSLMIATVGLYGGKYSENWKNVDPGYLLHDIKVAEGLIKQHGIPQHLVQILKRVPHGEAVTALDPANPPAPAAAKPASPAAEPEPEGPAQQEPEAIDQNEHLPNEPYAFGADPDWTPSEALLAYWKERGLEPGDTDPIGRTVTNANGDDLPF